MRSITNLLVKAGDLLKAGQWNEAGRLMQSIRLISGYGIRLRTTSNGTIISAMIPRSAFVGRWKCQLEGESRVLVKPGAINGVEATIKGVLLSGDPKRNQAVPVLELRAIQLDSEGKGYIAAEVQCSDDGLWAIKTVEIVQVAYLNSDDGKEPPKGNILTQSSAGVPNLEGRRARVPLAMLRRRAAGNIELFQIAYHDFGHTIKTVADRKLDQGRHFFYAS